MKLRFLGTRGYIDVKSRRHRRHSALLVGYRNARVVIDWGIDWANRFGCIAPDAIFLTHAHPDHAFGLKAGAPCPVYASDDAWGEMADFPIRTQHSLNPGESASVAGIGIESCAVLHSLRAPAVGYRISAGRTTIFYVPDVVEIPDRADVLSKVCLYIGDGATIDRPLVRYKDGKAFGHTTLRAQVDWCAEAGIGQALFTHCGSQIVGGDERVLRPKIRAIGRAFGVQVEIAHDGMEKILR